MIIVVARSGLFRIRLHSARLVVIHSSFSQTFESGSWVWVPHETEMYLPAQALKSFQQGQEAEVKYEDGKVSVVGSDLLVGL